MDDVLSNRAAVAINELMERFKLSPEGPYAGLGLLETAILARVAAKGEPPVQGDVAQAMALPKTTMTSAVGRLERRGLVRRGRSATDGRARTLILTEEGRQLAERLVSAQVDASRAMLDALHADDRARFVAMLERIAAAGGDPHSGRQGE